jgi:hypothetical protein
MGLGMMLALPLSIVEGLVLTILLSVLTERCLFDMPQD